jgi:hypothetical protein
MEPAPVSIPGDDAPERYLASRLDHSDILKITRDGRRVTIGFNGKQIGGDSRCLADLRDGLFNLIESGDFDCVVFDLTSVQIVLGSLLGLISCADAQGCEVELLNPSQELQEILRAAKLDTWLLIRGTTVR